MRRFTILSGILLLGLSATSLARADHVLESYVRPGEPSRVFPSEFVVPPDAQSSGELYSWTDPRMGGWGGDYEGSEPCPPGHVAHTPVVFVHGTAEDAPTAWTNSLANPVTTVNVRNAFIQTDDGWCPRELWAVSYTGSRGYLTYNDANAEEVYQFIQSVRAYTGAQQVDVVGHSLGVTIVRKAIRNHFDDTAVSWLRRFVAIGGPNHGSTVCRGFVASGADSASHPCEELDPDSPWLDDLNSIGEAPPGPDYLVVYDSAADHFFVGPDARSPRLEGACNHDMPGTMHLAIARGPASVPIYRAFLAHGTLPSCDS